MGCLFSKSKTQQKSTVQKQINNKPKIEFVDMNTSTFLLTKGADKNKNAQLKGLNIPQNNQNHLNQKQIKLDLLPISKIKEPQLNEKIQNKQLKEVNMSQNNQNHLNQNLTKKELLSIHEIKDTQLNQKDAQSKNIDLINNTSNIIQKDPTQKIQDRSLIVVHQKSTTDTQNIIMRLNKQLVEVEQQNPLIFQKLINKKYDQFKKDELQIIFQYEERAAQIGILLIDSKKYNQAYNYLQNYIDMHLEKIQLNLNKETLAIVLNALAKIYCFYKNYQQSIQSLKQSSNIYKETKGQKSAEYINSLIAIGDQFYIIDQFLQALQIYEKSAQLQQKTNGKESLNYTGVLQKIIEVQIQLKQYELALQNNQQCLKIKEQLKENKIERTIVNFKNMANIYFCQKDYSKSIQYCKKCIQIAEPIKLKQIAYATALYLMGNVNYQLKNMKQVQSNYLTAKQLCQSQKYYQLQVNVLTNLSRYYKQLNKQQQYESCNNRILNIALAI